MLVVLDVSVEDMMAVGVVEELVRPLVVLLVGSIVVVTGVVLLVELEPEEVDEPEEVGLDSVEVVLVVVYNSATVVVLVVSVATVAVVLLLLVEIKVLVEVQSGV